jgi:hypothetical protein
MAEKFEKIDQQAANKHLGSDEEQMNTPESNALRRKRRIKCIFNFIVLQIVHNLIFYFLVMRVRTPKVKLGTVTIQNLVTGSQDLPYFDMSFTAQVRIKNTNFGSYSFNSTNATFMYEGVTVGQALIPNGTARWLSTKRVNVTVNANSSELISRSNFKRALGRKLSSGFLNLSSQAMLSGRVAVMSLIKKKSFAQMNCTIAINLSAKAVQYFNCM